MKHTLKKTNDSHVSLSVELDKADLAIAKAQAVKNLAPSVKAAGFRPGKVPADVAEKNLDPNLLNQETAELAINTAINDAAVAEELRILDRPHIEMKEFVPEQSLNFTAEVDVLPDIKLGDYKKLKIKAEKAEVSDKDIDEVIDRMRSGMAEKQAVEHEAKNGDEATIDFVGKKDGEAFDGGSAQDYQLALGSNSFIPGFEEAIVGHKAGDKFDIPLEFPKDYHAENLKGQKVVFEINLKAVNEIKLPEVNDDFAKKCGPFKTVEELKSDVKRELTAQKDRQAEEKLKDDLIGELVKVSDVPVPDVLVDDQMKSIEQDARQNLMYRGQTLEQYIEAQGFKDEADWKDKEVKPNAVRRVQAGLALSELSKLEKIDVSQNELEERLAQMKQQYPNMTDQLDRPEARRDLANRVITEKTLDRLIELNQK
ncbi:MAG TPA: trigger factor [Candidatus Saccharimonadales bacterium]|nr:trigger factor [Candidatus Saccharimonadales bacterium]